MSDTCTRGSSTDAPSDRLAVECAGREWCPLTAAITTALNRKWHAVIVDRLLAQGPLGFTALEEAVDGITSKTLSAGLDDLEEKGLVERRIVSEKPFRVEYALTDRGRGLEPALQALAAWGRRSLTPVEGET